MAEWFPTVFYTFKFVVLGVGMFYAIKWHYDQGKKKDGAKERRAVLHAAGKAAAVFLLSLLVLGLLTYFLATKLGLDLNFL
jgi:hypothetical protein